MTVMTGMQTRGTSRHPGHQRQSGYGRASHLHLLQGEPTPTVAGVTITPCLGMSQRGRGAGTETETETGKGTGVMKTR